MGEAAHLVVINTLSLFIDIVGYEVEVLAGKVHRAAMGEVAAVGQAHAHHRVARLEQREVHGCVCLRAGMGLDVGMLGAKELLGALAGHFFDLVYKLAAAVVTLSGISLGILVGQVRTHRLHDGGTDKVFRSNQLDVGLLALQFALHGGVNFRVGLLDGRVFQHGLRLLIFCFQHHIIGTQGKRQARPC